jgi:Zn-dependent M28 family amino/carboxypeptidase
MESRNIAIKFEGSKWNDSAVLFTAHYDTSSLAPGEHHIESDAKSRTLTPFPGATDDSIAVVSLIQMAEYLASSQPARSIILLFDDGEEDGLNGAHM